MRQDYLPVCRTSRTNLRYLILVMLMFLLPFGCTQQNGQKISLSGSSTVAPLAQEIATRYEKLHPGVRVDVQTGGSTRGIIDVSKGLVDIGMASRPLKAKEKGLTPHTIAWDGISIIVNASNPIQSLKEEQIRDIYTGRISNWKSLGLADNPIVVVNKAEGHSTLELFLAYYKLSSRDIKADIIIGDNQQALKTVIGNPLAIAYVSIGAAEYEVSKKSPIKLVDLGSIKATSHNVATGEFPLARPLNLVSTKNTSELAKSFIQFAQSEQVNDLIKQQFFVAHAN